MGLRATLATLYLLMLDLESVDFHNSYGRNRGFIITQ